jgi:long-chain fatty acid transport protein
VLAATDGIEGHARVRGDDNAWGFNIGAMFQVGQGTTFGLHYRSSIDYSVTGTARFDSPAILSPVGASIVNAATATGGPLANGPVFVDLQLPEVATASLRHKIGTSIEVLADVAWTGWSSVQELRVVRSSGETLSNTPEEWSDSWRYALGGTYQVVSRLKLRAGVAHDQTPVPDSTRTPRLPDVDRTWLAVGSQWKMSEAIALDLAYAHLFSGEVPLDQDAGNPAVNALLVGEQSSDVDIVSLQISVGF